MENPHDPVEQEPEDEQARKPYHKPQLEEYGRIGAVTQSGYLLPGAEDAIYNSAPN
jgi:hypothetical protein